MDAIKIELALSMRRVTLAISCFLFVMFMFLLLGAANAAQSPDDGGDISPGVRWNAGDEQIWAQLDFDESSWAEFNGLAPMPDGVFWIRVRITITESFKPPANSLFSFSGAGAFDIYFDGHLLGSSGVVGSTPREERPGSSRFYVGVPREFLAVGDHVLAVRASAHHIRDPSDFFILYQIQSADRTFSRNSVNLLMLGVALASVSILSVFFGASSSSAQQPWMFKSSLFIAIGVAAIAAVETGDLLGLFPYTWRPATDLVAMAAAGSVFVALPALLLMRLSVRRKWFWFAGLLLVVLVSAVSWGKLPYEHDTRVFISLGVYCLAICANTGTRERRHATYYAIGIAACLLGIVIDPDFMFTFLVALAALLALSFALDIRAQELATKQAQLTAARLEAEMLKLNIQPHFLMNSLTAITEWIETAPMDALRFIQGLADEFRSLSMLSGKTLVHIGDEIELCRTHLQLMGMRLKTTFRLETKGLTGSETIPPGVFHTLIENALSHNHYRETTIEFELAKTIAGNETTYTMTAPLGADTGHRDRSTGSGEKYVKSRLEESYPGQWRLTSESKNGQWVTQIHLKGL